MRSKLRPVALLLSVFGLLQVPGWSQCVMCATALASSPEGRALASSFRYGIIMLLVTPYLIIGSIVFAIYRAYKKRADSPSWPGGVARSAGVVDLETEQPPRLRH